MIKKGLFLIASAFLYLISLLPFTFLYLIADLLFLILYYQVGYRRKVVKENLANAFPGKTERERDEIEKKYYRFLADLIMESVKMISISKDELQKRFHLKNIDELTRHFERGKSVIGVTSHYGNWEWAGQAISLELTEPVLVVYKPLANKNFEKLMIRARARFGSKLVAMKHTYRKVVEFKNRRHLLVLVGDQTPAHEDLEYFTPFLNQQTAVFLGTERIAKAAGYAVIYTAFRRTKRGYYEGTIETIVEDAANTKEFEITKLHTAKLEAVINKEPEYWLWSHRRWKFKPEDLAK